MILGLRLLPQHMAGHGPFRTYILLKSRADLCHSFTVPTNALTVLNGTPSTSVPTNPIITTQQSSLLS